MQLLKPYQLIENVYTLRQFIMATTTTITITL